MKIKEQNNINLTFLELKKKINQKLATIFFELSQNE